MNMAAAAPCRAAGAACVCRAANSQRERRDDENVPKFDHAYALILPSTMRAPTGIKRKPWAKLVAKLLMGGVQRLMAAGRKRLM